MTFNLTAAIARADLKDQRQDFIEFRDEVQRLLTIAHHSPPVFEAAAELAFPAIAHFKGKLRLAERRAA